MSVIRLKCKHSYFAVAVDALLQYADRLAFEFPKSLRVATEKQKIDMLHIDIAMTLYYKFQPKLAARRPNEKHQPKLELYQASVWFEALLNYQAPGDDLQKQNAAEIIKNDLHNQIINNASQYVAIFQNL